eukprot:9472415-Pyramimonas_sp.AAC.1
MEKSLMKDGVWEMMSEIAYQHHAGKPKNGGLSPIQASAKWQAMYKATGAVTDLLGENPEYPSRLQGPAKGLGSINRSTFLQSSIACPLGHWPLNLSCPASGPLALPPFCPPWPFTFALMPPLTVAPLPPPPPSPPLTPRRRAEGLAQSSRNWSAGEG